MNGVINVLKPPAMTSNNVVADIKKIFGVKRVGHTGTLDPGAAGVLPVCLGRATKLADYIMHGDKEYIAEMTVGIETDTLDSYGTVTDTSNIKIDDAMLRETAKKFVGEIMQVPPAYSAVKHNGKALYQLARQGITIEKPARKVHIYSIDFLKKQENRYLFHISCSKGTYIRTLISDIAHAAGSCAYTSFLMRTKTSGFSIEQTYTLDEIAKLKNDVVTSMEETLLFMQRIDLPDYLYSIVISGTPIELSKAKLTVEYEKDYAVYCKNELIGIANRKEDKLKIAAMIRV